MWLGMSIILKSPAHEIGFLRFFEVAKGRATHCDFGRDFSAANQTQRAFWSKRP